MIRVRGLANRDNASERVRSFFNAPEYLAELERRTPSATEEAFCALLCLAELLIEQGITPGVRLARDGQGRPYLPGLPELEFNLTHSGGAAFCVLSNEGRVGVDAERRREFPNAERIAKRFFSAGEQGTEFFLTWTRKEAYLKYLGTGLGGTNGISAVDTSCRTDVRFEARELAGCCVTVCVPAAAGEICWELDALDGQ